jgi:hypothetical protein
MAILVEGVEERKGVWSGEMRHDYTCAQKVFLQENQGE